MLAKKFSIAALLLLLIMGVGLLIYFLGMSSGYERCYVEVTIVNASNHDIRSVKLTHKKGISLIEDLKKNQKKKIKFVPEGESVYSLKVVFANGRQLNGSDSYVSAGYVITDTITEDKIMETEFRGQY